MTTANAPQDLKLRPRTAELSSQSIVSNENSGTQVKLSKLTNQIQTDSSRDIDYDRLAKIQASMDAGELVLDSDKIANVLVQDIFQH
ncbi:Negative regulator of flagellin synthesis (anti-sigma28 factor) [Yersinia bercovieri ATCC 43970]|uniref:Flagellar biosynthesis protein FlgM n=3 Tax=Yersinia bercovieri TaxID=634 RepID=A0A2G4U8V4_YERBE|nr:Negative regulator of flagellin synthesis (anti-sigma28 factor) [Yersinia bercovieri ATCC 43970]PHZ29156.1 flagellar biosynthesis protein FlgM [Yersinia bercovieri]QKJ08959.1 flagellar biosynthesis protein FlgM [Yersinia bercovieri ATCC 43970]